MSGSLSRTAAKAVGGGTKEMLYLPPEALVIDKEFDLRVDVGNIDQLAKDIASDGFHSNEPILVRFKKSTGKFHVADGRRRTRAANIAKEKYDWKGQVAAVPLDSDTSDQELIFRTMNSNNEHRKPFTQMEEGAYFLKLRDELGVTEQEIADRINRSVTTVRDRIALVKIDPSIKPEIEKFINDGTLSPTAALDLAKKKDPNDQIATWKDIKARHNSAKSEEKEAPATGKSTSSNRIKGKDIRGAGTHISLKTFKDSRAVLDKAARETGHDRYKFAVTVLDDILKGKVVKI